MKYRVLGVIAYKSNVEQKVREHLMIGTGTSSTDPPHNKLNQGQHAEA